MHQNSFSLLHLLWYTAVRGRPNLLIFPNYDAICDFDSLLYILLLCWTLQSEEHHVNQTGKSNKDDKLQDGTIQLSKGKVQPKQAPCAFLFCLLLTSSPLILIFSFLSLSVYNPSCRLADKNVYFCFTLKRSVLWSVGLYTFGDIFWTTSCFILLCEDRTKHQGHQNQIR